MQRVPDRGVMWRDVCSNIVRGSAVLAAFLVFLLGYLVGRLDLLLIIVPALALAGTALSRLVAAVRGRIEWGFFRHPLQREFRPQLWQLINRCLAYLLVAITVVIVVPQWPFGSVELLAALGIVIIAPTLALLVLEWLPQRRVRWGWNALCVVASAFLAFQLARLLTGGLFLDPIPVQAPFEGEWIVAQGGPSSLLNHHYRLESQRCALDLISLENGSDANGPRDDLASYACFGAPLYAPADGRVVRVLNDRPDQAIGTTDTSLPVGNHVVIEIGANRYVLLAHLMQGSATVAPDDTVRAGQLIGRCGNSGNTSQPHLHLQVQDQADWDAKGLKTFPIQFAEAQHVRWGVRHSKQQGELRRNDRVIAEQRSAAS